MLLVIIDALYLAPLLVALPCVTCIVTSFPAQLGRIAFHLCAIHDAAFATACPVLVEVNAECAIVLIFFHFFIYYGTSRLIPTVLYNLQNLSASLPSIVWMHIS